MAQIWNVLYECLSFIPKKISNVVWGHLRFSQIYFRIAYYLLIYIYSCDDDRKKKINWMIWKGKKVKLIWKFIESLLTVFVSITITSTWMKMYKSKCKLNTENKRWMETESKNKSKRGQQQKKHITTAICLVDGTCTRTGCANTSTTANTSTDSVSRNWKSSLILNTDHEMRNWSKKSYVIMLNK